MIEKIAARYERRFRREAEPFHDFLLDRLSEGASISGAAERRIRRLGECAGMSLEAELQRRLERT
jgi:hypothetical protein